MQFTTIFAGALLAAAALAAPARSGSLEARIARRQEATGRRTNPPQFVGIGKSLDASGSNTEYTDNWAGVVITSPPADESFKAVSAQFIVPAPKLPPGGDASQTYSGCVWVGIDGNTYQNAILQAGIDFSIEKGKVTYHAWYEWFPADMADFSGISISAGDEISVSVESSTPFSGTARIKNLSNGQEASKFLVSIHKLSGQNAEWIVEDYAHNKKLVPFIDFDSVTFTQTSFTTNKNNKGNSSTGSIFEIQQGGAILTNSSQNDGRITVRYT